MYLYRRVAVLAGAHAEIQPLARAWGVLVYGYIGRNHFRVLEPYIDLRIARQRRREVNRQGIALVDSVENLLFPLQTYVARYDTDIHKHPPLPLQDAKLQPYTRVDDLYSQIRQSRNGR